MSCHGQMLLAEPTVMGIWRENVMTKTSEQKDDQLRHTCEQDLGELLQRFYDDLRRLARARLNRLARGRTLGTTELLHDAYLRLHKKRRAPWPNRRFFFSDMAQAMRDIVVEYVRRQAAVKHGGGLVRANISSTLPGRDDLGLLPQQTLALFEALERLHSRFPQAAEVLFLRYFAGFTADEIAAALSTSKRTVERKWQLARTWLHKELTVH